MILRRHTNFHPKRIIVDHPRSVVDDCCYVLKFWLDGIYSFGTVRILDFRVLAWYCLFTPTFRGWGVGHISPKWCREKGQYSQNSHKSVISPNWGVAQPNRFAPTFAWLLPFPTEYRVKILELKFSGVTILPGVEFSVFPLIVAWTLQQCSTNALPVMKTECWHTCV